MHQKYENAAIDYVMMTSPFFIPIQNCHSSGHCTCDTELNIDFGYCLQTYDVIITLSIAHLQYDTANHQKKSPQIPNFTMIDLENTILSTENLFWHNDDIIVNGL